MATLSSVIVIGTFSARPAPGIPGRLFGSTDTNVVYRDNGSGWEVYVDGSGGGGGGVESIDGQTGAFTFTGPGVSHTGTAYTFSGGGGGAVASVNGQTGTVVLTAASVGADPAGGATGLQTKPVSATVPTTGQLLQFNGSSWVPATVSTSIVQVFPTITGTPNGSLTTFTMSSVPQFFTVSRNGLVQRRVTTVAGVANTYSVSGSTLTFAVAPATGDVIYVEGIQ